MLKRFQCFRFAWFLTPSTKRGRDGQATMNPFPLPQVDLPMLHFFALINGEDRSFETSNFLYVQLTVFLLSWLFLTNPNLRTRLPLLTSCSSVYFSVLPHHFSLFVHWNVSSSYITETVMSLMPYLSLRSSSE